MSSLSSPPLQPPVDVTVVVTATTPRQMSSLPHYVDITIVLRHYSIGVAQ
jgi:hypothetical protein